jgi:LuxR family transcriptional regulator, maltose regulon positive regulatory protein
VQIGQEQHFMTNMRPPVDHVTIPTRSGIPEGLLLKTKLMLPTSRETTIARPALIQLLERGVQGKLTVLTAPPGFGKTTLLSSWARHTAHDVAWVALDPRDNDPIRFWTYVIAAIDTRQPGVGTSAFSLLHAAPAAPIEMILTALLNAVTALATPITLVLDDCHSITTPGIYDLLAFLIEHVPPQLHLVLASRVVPPLNLARLRVNGEVTDIRAEQLRFSLSETTKLLNQVLGLALPPDDVATLEVRTEGWIAGLRLAAAALQNQPDPAAFVANLRKSHRFVLDYLMEEVLALQSPAHQQFLFQTSMLERLTADLCNAVTDQSDGQEWLQTLEQANLFIEPLDQERRWYRYHRLFAEFLRAAFQRSDPFGGTAVHRRATTWFIAHGMPADALHHALAVGDMELAADLIEQLAGGLLEHGEVVTLKTWISAIPTPIIRVRPRLALFYAWSLLGTTQHDATIFWIDVVEAGIAEQAETLDRAEMQVMKSELELIHAMLNLVKGDFAASGTHVHHARVRLTLQHTWLRNWMVHIEAISYVVQGELAMARETLAAEPFSSISAANQRLPDHMAGMYAAMYMDHGQFKTGLVLYEQLLQHKREAGQHPMRANSIYTGLGTILYEHNDLVRARHVAQRQYDLGQSSACAVATMQGLLLLAQVQWAEHDVDAARASLRSVEQHIAQLASDDPLHLHVASTWITFWAKRRDIVATRHWIALYSTIQRTNRVETPATIVHGFHLELAFARLALLEEHWAEAHTRLQALIEAAEPRGWGRVVLEARVLQALAWQAQGDRDQAATVAIQALTFAAPEGFVRLFLDEGDAMRRLLVAVLPSLQRQREEALAAYVFSLLATFGSPDLPEHAAAPAIPRASTTRLHPSTPALIEPLTERETEVLHLIAAGMSNQEIAQTLVVGVGTVKTHLISIYGKLGVHKRTQAVARAREINLL